MRDAEALGLGDLGPGTRESLTGEVPETMTYPEWLARQSAEIQDEVLGPTRGEMFRAGTPLDKFVDETGKQFTLAQLAAQEGIDIPPGTYIPPPRVPVTTTPAGAVEALTTTEKTIGKTYDELLADIEARREELSKMTNAQLRALLTRPPSSAKKDTLIRMILGPDLDDLVTIDKERAIRREGAPS